MWSHHQIHARARRVFDRAITSGVDFNTARTAMIDTAIAMTIDNASVVADRVGAHVAEDEILALKERCTVLPQRSWRCRILGCGA